MRVRRASPTGAALAAMALTLTACAGASTGSPTTMAQSPTASASTGSSAPATPGEPIIITAADLPEITPLSKPGPQTPARIVSLATGVGETLVALGVGERVVGRDETSEVPALRAAGIVDKGMIPKVDSAVAALRAGVDKVSFVDGRTPHSVLLEIFTDAGVGTEVVL